MAEPISHGHVTEDKRVLSIQSHVVAGYAGNKSAVFPMQTLGFEVDILNTVQFSNHTGYGRWGGTRFDATHLRDVFEHLDSNGLLRQSHLLTGYVPGAEALRVVKDIATRLKSINPNLVYVLDTVCGDDGRLYVSPEVVPIYKEIIPLATVMTPNHFEAELFSDIKLDSVSAVRQALQVIHERYLIPNVLISSVPVNRNQLSGLRLPANCEDHQVFLLCAGSTRVSSESASETFAVVFPKFAEHFEGVGDVFASLTLAHFNTSENSSITPLAATAELVIASVAQIIANTRSNALSKVASPTDLQPSSDESASHRVSRLRNMELRLVQSADAIHRPLIYHKAQPLT